MTHQINREELAGKYETILASSTKQLKKLQHVLIIDDYGIYAFYMVIDNAENAKCYFEHLSDAVNLYNSIEAINKEEFNPDFDNGVVR